MAYINVYPSRINWENEPSIVSPINATNLNKMDYALYEMDQTMQGWDVSKANQSDMLASLKDVSYDTTTGVFVFTWWNGTTKTIDLNIEKIPVSFSMDANGVITMTTDDGSTFTADVGSLIKTYTFADSSVIDFTVTTDTQGNKTVTADIVDGSITGNKLQPNYLADVQTAATNAANSATASASSSQDSEAWAVGTRGGAPVPSTDPAYNNNAEYWANHTSASLVGLNDVNVTSPTDKQALTYDATTQKWVNGQAAGGAQIDDTTTSATKVWSSNKTNTELSGKASSSDLSALSTTVTNNNTAQNNKHKVTTKQVATTGWTSDTTSQSGTTLYKKTIALSHVYVTSPTVDIGASGVLPTVAEQESYNLLQYVTVDDTVPCLCLYASAIPTTAFYINVEGVD